MTEPTENLPEISFVELLKLFQDNHASKLPVFVNLAYKTAMAHKKTESDFINDWAETFSDILSSSAILDSQSHHEALSQSQQAQQEINEDNDEVSNAAWFMLVLLCTVLQQELTLPEFALLKPEVIKDQKNNILALKAIHDKQVASDSE